MSRRAPVKLKTRRLLPAAYLAIALGVSVFAGWRVAIFWGGMPVQQVSRLTQADFEAVYDRVHGLLGGEEREAYAMQYAGKTFCEALTGASTPEETALALTTAVNAAGQMQLGRLYLAAIRIFQMERGGAPVEDWWPNVRGYLEGLQRGDFLHKQELLAGRWATAYESVGVGAGTAYGLAIDAVGHPHGPFLEFFVPRLGRMIEERAAVGDEENAELCRTIRMRLLEQWTLAPGAIALRMQAAEYLADLFEQEDADDLNAWRTDYVAALADRPVTVLDPHSKPALAPAVHERLLRASTLVYWLSAGACSAAVMSLLLFWAWNGSNADALKKSAIFALIAAVIVFCGGLLWLYFCHDAIRDDYRRAFSGLVGWPRGPLFACGLTLIAVLTAGVLRHASGSVKPTLAARTGAIATGVWIVLSLTAAACAWTGDRVQADYEALTRAALENPTTTMCGADADRRLDSLRRRRHE